MMARRQYALVGMVVAIFLLNMVLPAFGDGFAQENLPPATLGNRQAGLFIKVNPPILTVESVNNASIFLRFYNANTNQTIQHVSYFIKVEKGDKLLMQDLFHTHSGELTLKIRPQEGPVAIYGGKEPILGGWIEEGGPIVVQGPVFLQGGLYHFTMEIFGVDFDNIIFKPEDAPKFEAWLSVGDVSNNTVTFEQNKYDIEIISYYDKISNFAFDEQKKQVSYEMPFDWNVERWEKNPIFVHEEVKVPKNFTMFTSSDFTGTVNGIPIGGRSLLVDPYSFEDKLVVHLLMNKQQLIDIQKQIATDSSVPKDMVFTLEPLELQQNATNSMNLFTDNNKVRILFSWNKQTVEPGQPVEFTLTFFDAATNTILRNTDYNFKIFDDSGNAIFVKDNALSGEVDSYPYTFEKTGTVTIQVHVNGVGDPTSKIDISYMGTAESSINVVPEFPASFVMIIMALVLAGTIFATRRYIPVMKLI